MLLVTQQLRFLRSLLRKYLPKIYGVLAMMETDFNKVFSNVSMEHSQETIEKAVQMAKEGKSVSPEEVMSVCSLNPLRKTLKKGV